MRERTSLEDQISAVKRLEQELEDAITLIELGEAEGDEGTVLEGEGAIRDLQAESARRQFETLLSGELMRYHAALDSLHVRGDQAEQIRRAAAAVQASRAGGLPLARTTEPALPAADEHPAIEPPEFRQVPALEASSDVDIVEAELVEPTPRRDLR